MSIRIKYTEKSSQDGYMYKTFNSNDEFTNWMIKNYNLITIYEIKEI